MSFLDSQKNKHDHEFIHSWYLLIISFLSLLFLLVSSNNISNLVLTILTLAFYFNNKLSPKTFSKLITYAAFFSFSFFLLSMLYTSESYKTGITYNFLNFTFYEGAIANASKNFSRLFFLTLVSMSSTHAINYSKVILYLIIHWGLKVFWGYPLLIALNSILLFKEEFDRIRISAKFRGLGWWDRLFILFPLLVFAIRHSQRGSLSLVTRGLSPSKGFYFTYALRSRDRIILGLYLLVYICLMAIGFYYR